MKSMGFGDGSPLRATELRPLSVTETRWELLRSNLREKRSGTSAAAAGSALKFAFDLTSIV